ncbi:uncharacterized protein [Ptychodera flava]|uniref:uncharacterized protein n=1 Tax=Ptychodera flava TaxID=63121 RepID=UPI00396A6495
MTEQMSIVLLILTKREFDSERVFYGFAEWQKFWEDLRAIMLMLPVTALTWIMGTYSSNTDDLNCGYVFAGCAFTQGSMIFLMFFATNVEVLVAIRVRFSGDDDEKRELKQYKQTEHDRFDARKANREELREEEKENQEEERKMKSLKSSIVGLFHRIDVNKDDDDDNDDDDDDDGGGGGGDVGGINGDYNTMQ